MGRIFTNDRAFWLNTYWLRPYGGENRWAPHGLRQSCRPSSEDYGGECPGVYYIRLQRDGWRLVGREDSGKHTRVYRFEKPVGQWLLRKLAYATMDHPPGKGCYYDEHQLYNSTTGQTIDCREWEWTEVDRSRLVWAEHGKLFTCHLGEEGLADVTQLYDFNPMTFEAVKAPYY